MGKKRNKPFTFPDILLQQINECSTGFILFSFDIQGQPQIHSCFDNVQAAMAMQYYVNTWGKAVDKLNINNVIDDMSSGENPPEE